MTLPSRLAAECPHAFTLSIVKQLLRATSPIADPQWGCGESKLGMRFSEAERAILTLFPVQQILLASSSQM